MNKFTPFHHDNLEVKRAFLNVARNHYDIADKENNDKDRALAYALSSALLYMNHADYLAQWFAQSIQKLANDAVSSYYSRQIVVARRSNTKDINIGTAIEIIKRYEFADKETLITLLEKIDKSRNALAHTIFKIDPSKMSEIDEAVRNLKDDTEELIDFTDQFKVGMPPKSLMDILKDMNKED